MLGRVKEGFIEAKHPLPAESCQPLDLRVASPELFNRLFVVRTYIVEQRFSSSACHVRRTC